MKDAIIVLNAGSSSLKFSIYRLDDSTPVAVLRGQVESLGTKPRFKASRISGEKLADEHLPSKDGSPGHAEAFAHIAEWAREQAAGEMAPIAVGHRVAHGGLQFSEPTLIDDAVMAELERLIPLVPLHQPPNLAGIRAVKSLRPDLPQVACFDTAFHRGRASVTERFGLPDELYQRGLRRWGFHGLSYQFIAEAFAKIAPDVAGGRVIVAHLGSGASMCAMRNGRSVDTTMSFSALDGLPMGTRCGSLDPGAVLFLVQQRSVKEVEDLLYRKSGLLGISGLSNDVRELLESDLPLAREAIDYFVCRATREIGSLTASLGGLDALVFTAGIGENSPVIRQRICEQLRWLGIIVDPNLNQQGVGRISPDGAAPSVWVVRTDEESVIASGTIAAINKKVLAHA